MRITGSESLLCAVTWTGEFKVAPFAGAQIVTEGVGALLVSQSCAVGTVTLTVAFVSQAGGVRTNDGDAVCAAGEC